MMTEQLILNQLLLMPETLKQEALHYMFYLVNNYKNETGFTLQHTTPVSKRKPIFGSAKGKYILSADFDEPLDDFKEYM